MLDQDGLRGAISDGQKVADLCGHFCRVGGTIDDGRYRLFHNGLGSRDTDSQVVHASGPLGLNREHLAMRLTSWIKGLHRGERVDLNAAMAADGWVSDGKSYLVGEEGLELFTSSSIGTIIPNSTTHSAARGVEISVLLDPSAPTLRQIIAEFRRVTDAARRAAQAMDRAV